MRVTVCELPAPPALAADWLRLAHHLRDTGSDLLVLPELPFASWLPEHRRFDAVRWQRACAAHDAWLARLPELSVPAVVGTRPVERAGRRLNEAFCWTRERGYAALHAKNRLPEEPDFWEATWFHPGPPKPDTGDADRPATVTAPAGAATVAALICSELWFFERARAAGRAGATLLATPRATSTPWVDRWLVAGRAAALSGGLYSLSSNRCGTDPFGGGGWIIDPEGTVLARTTPERPFVTRAVDLAAAEAAQQAYPRTL